MGLDAEGSTISRVVVNIDAHKWRTAGERDRDFKRSPSQHTQGGHRNLFIEDGTVVFVT